jgi:hypothetical protein
VPKDAAAEKPIVTQHIHEALVAVGAELAKVGISKDRKNEQQNFRFRGIDDVMNVVSPILAKHNVLFLPCYTDYPDVERVTGKGATLIYSKVKGEFTFVSAKDGSSVSVTTFGVAMDSGDKSLTKSMSISLKYALLQTFLIPTESNEDPDATTHDPSVPKPPAGFEEWFTDLVAVKDHGFDAIKAAWKDSKEEHRAYAMKFRTAEWDQIKKDAAEISKKQKATP